MLMKPWRTASDMAEPAWQAEHCVDTAASREFVWAYMSNVGMWDDPPAQFVLEGPFTMDPAAQRRCRASRRSIGCFAMSCQEYTIEFPFDAATMYFKWTFAELADGVPGSHNTLFLRDRTPPHNFR